MEQRKVDTSFWYCSDACYVDTCFLQPSRLFKGWPWRTNNLKWAWPCTSLAQCDRGAGAGPRPPLHRCLWAEIGSQPKKVKGPLQLQITSLRKSHGNEILPHKVFTKRVPCDVCGLIVSRIWDSILNLDSWPLPDLRVCDFFKVFFLLLISLIKENDSIGLGLHFLHPTC